MLRHCVPNEGQVRVHGEQGLQSHLRGVVIGLHPRRSHVSRSGEVNRTETPPHA